jgi:hypothetical protein
MKQGTNKALHCTLFIGAALSFVITACAPGFRMKENQITNPGTRVIPSNPTTEALIPYKAIFKSLSGDLVAGPQINSLGASSISNGQVQFQLQDVKTNATTDYSYSVEGLPDISTINGSRPQSPIANEPQIVISSRCSPDSCRSFQVAVKFSFFEGSRLIDLKVLALSMDTTTKVTKSIYMPYGPDVNVITMNEIMNTLEVYTDPLATP